MAAAPKTAAIEARLASIESRIGDIDPREILTLLRAQVTKIEAMVVEIKQAVPSILAQAPQPLGVEQVERILADNPHARFVALTSHGGLRAGDRFDSTAKFPSKRQFVSTFRGQKLKVAAAA